MPKKTLRSEVDELRAELEALRRERVAAPRASAGARKDEAGAGSVDAETDGSASDQADVEKAIQDFVQSTKQDLDERPAMAVALAFLVGILIGRLSRS